MVLRYKDAIFILNEFVCLVIGLDFGFWVLRSDVIWVCVCFDFKLFMCAVGVSESQIVSLVHGHCPITI